MSVGCGWNCCCACGNGEFGRAKCSDCVLCVVCCVLCVVCCVLNVVNLCSEFL